MQITTSIFGSRVALERESGTSNRGAKIGGIHSFISGVVFLNSFRKSPNIPPTGGGLNASRGKGCKPPLALPWLHPCFAEIHSYYLIEMLEKDGSQWDWFDDAFHHYITTNARHGVMLLNTIYDVIRFKCQFLKSSKCVPN